jgi:predicted ATPase
LYDPQQPRRQAALSGFDPGVGCGSYLALTLWHRGYPDQARRQSATTLALAHELAHPFSLGFARLFAAFLYQWRRDMPAVQAQAEAAVALAMQGRGEEGRAQLRQGIASYRATGAALHVPYLGTLLAEVYANLGHTADGLQALTEAHTLVEQHEERYWEAEICRLRGVVLLRQSEAPQAEAEAWLQRALDVARRQEAKALELRTAMSLSRLWQQQGKRQGAHALLASVYNWFTEGFDTADLREAKALLDTPQ